MARSAIEMHDHVLDEFLEHELRDVLRVVVQLVAEELDLTDTAVFVFDIGLFQLNADVHEKRLRRMRSADDIVIEGDYHDRTGAELRTLGPFPFRVSAVHLVYEVIDVQQHPVGAFLATEQYELVLGVNFHLDDVEVGAAPGVLWTYVGRLVPNARSVVVKRRTL